MVSRLPSYCPHCGHVIPAGEVCQCRPRLHRKRKPTSGDTTRKTREPWRREYSSTSYRKARQAVIARQHGRCADCGRVCAVHDGTKWRTHPYGGEVDHDGMLRRGADSSPDHMTLRCRSCHAKADAQRRREGP